jgi:hypothetical protein
MVSLTLAASLHRITETRQVAAGFPDLGVHDDRAIDTDHLDVLAAGAGRRVADHVLPPGVLDVALQLGAQRAVVPETADPAVDFARLEDEAAPLAQGDDLLHGVRFRCHCCPIPPSGFTGDVAQHRPRRASRIAKS